jgi:AraC-like DNA-binding protein
MSGSITSVFGDSADFAAALRPVGVSTLLLTGQGRFRARLTQVTLHRLRLVAAEEKLPRIAFVVLPADMVLVAFPLGRRHSPIWGGRTSAAGEIVTFGPRQRLHARTAGPSHWAAVLLRCDDLVGYGRALSGAEPVIPPAAGWRPPPPALQQLQRLHRAAIRMAETRSASLADAEAAHGLEQLLIHAVVECMSAGVAEREPPAVSRDRDLLARFEDKLRIGSPLRVADICATLGVSQPVLRRRCREHLGISPSRYLRLHKQVSRPSGSGPGLSGPDPVYSGSDLCKIFVKG